MARVGVAEEITTGVSRLAHPAMNPGALKNQMRTRRVKRTKVATSWKVMGPSSLYFSLNISETPLSLISGIRSRPSRMVMALVNGGAILDFRTRDGSTAMHRAVTTNNLETVRTMLELGASPNYRDSKNLTPLYHAVTQVTDPVITETLLHDHAVTGAQDLQGWQEVHQVRLLENYFIAETKNYNNFKLLPTFSTNQPVLPRNYVQSSSL